MILSQFEEAVWHRRGSDCDIAEAWHHGGEIVSAVEAVLEFGEVAGYMLVADGAVSASDGALDVAEGGVDPLESRVQGGLATGSSDDRLVDAAGLFGLRCYSRRVSPCAVCSADPAASGNRKCQRPVRH